MKKLLVRITKSVIISMTQEDLDMLKEACFQDGDRQMLNETVDLDCEGDLTIENIELPELGFCGYPMCRGNCVV
jgi:hypothetical protein